jgi:hypothetical protein
MAGEPDKHPDENIVGDLTDKETALTPAEVLAAGYFGEPVDITDDYVYTVNGVSGIPKPDPLA